MIKHIKKHLRPYLTKGFEYCWYKPNKWFYWLLPLSYLFRAIVAIRRYYYHYSDAKLIHFDVPVIVVGNISVGGTGKTPIVIALVKLLQAQGWKPGVISRGYGRHHAYVIRPVVPSSDPRICGDEPVVIAEQCECPVMVGVDRVRTAERLLADTDCNIIISDDGLQHYALRRDIEIVVLNHQQYLGNEHCLPAGPLREPVSRLKTVDFVLTSGIKGAEYPIERTMGEPVNIMSGKSITWTNFPKEDVHVIAGIAHPQNFFTGLQDAGLEITSHSFPDHHVYLPSELDFAKGKTLLMTEKDAIKCRYFAEPTWWYVPLEVGLDDTFKQDFLSRLIA